VQVMKSVNSRPALQRTVVLVSPDASFRRGLAETLTGMRWLVQEAAGGAEALCCLRENLCEALLLDSWLPDLEASDFASQLRLQYPSLDLIQVDEMLEAAGGARSSRRNELLHALRRVRGLADSTIPSSKFTADLAACVAPRGLRSPHVHGIDPTGGFLSGKAIAAPDHSTDTVDFNHVFPLSIDEPQPVSVESISTFENSGTSIVELNGMVGTSAAMQDLARRIQLVAARKTTVLIEGPTGSGKELVAQALHRLSSRANKPFIVINCAAIPETLLEAELFGHTKGAFTGAVQSRIGRIEAARGGTLFLDEIGEIPLALQSKLLRFLESGELQRIGENQPACIDVRVVAATHQPLMQRVAAGSFRSDLYFRLAVFLLQTPALSQRPEDIPALTAHFLDRLGENEASKSLDHEAMGKLALHGWPGNVRELAHVIERAYILAGNQSHITAADICFA
jgi:DNA-binding NtrC family response regulator